MNCRIAVTVSHPIQHFCPQYESWAGIEGVELNVYFGSAIGFKNYFDPSFGREVKWNTIRLGGFPHRFLNGDAVIPADAAIDAPSLDAALDAFDPDLVIVYGYYQKMQQRATRWAKAKGKKLAYISDSELLRQRSRIKQALKYPWLRAYFRKPDYFLTVGDFNEAYYRHYGVPQSKLRRMHFPIDEALYEDAYRERAAHRDAVRQKFGVAEDRFLLGVVGKLLPSKHQDHLIEALQLLERQGTFADLLVIGSGDYQPALEAKAAPLRHSRVHFAGFVSPEHLPPYYAALDAYAHPSAVEAHSLAVSEAIYLGCPVVLSDRCGSYGPDDDVQEGKNGFVFPVGDIPALASKLRQLMTDAPLRARFSEHSLRISRRFQELAHRGAIAGLAGELR